MRVCVVCVLLEWSLSVALAVIKSNYSALSGVHLSAACTNHTPAHLSKDCKEDIQAEICTHNRCQGGFNARKNI